MKTVDSRNNWRLIDEMLETETDEWRRHMLLQLKEHVQAECGSDLDALLKTMSSNLGFISGQQTKTAAQKGLKP